MMRSKQTTSKVWRWWCFLVSRLFLGEEEGGRGCSLVAIDEEVDVLGLMDLGCLFC